MTFNNQIYSKCNEGYGRLFATSSFLLACIRSNFSVFLESSTILTLILNLFIIASINFRKVRYSFFSFAIFSFLVFYNKEVLTLIDVLALMYILRGYSYKYLIQINAFVLTFFLIIWIFSLESGILKDEIMIMPKGTAHTLGYANPNGLGKLGFQIISTLFLISYGKWKLLLIFIIPVINELFYYYSAARTPWIGGYILMLIMLCTYFRIIKPWMRYFVAILPFIITTIIFYLARHYENYPEINLLFTGRLSNLSVTLSKMSAINLIIGKSIPEDVIMDGSYQMLILSGGIIGFIVFWKPFLLKVIHHWNVVSKLLPFILGVLACSVGENVFTTCGSVSLLFWFIFFNRVKI